MHDFEILDFWGKGEFFFLNGWDMAKCPQFKNGCMIFFEKMRRMISFFFFFLKMNEAWLNASSLQIDARLLKTLIFEKMIFFFFFAFSKWIRHGWMPLFENICEFLRNFIARPILLEWKIVPKQAHKVLENTK